jgi:arylformamidase
MLHDVTVPLRAGMPTWPGEPGPHLEQRKFMARGDPYNIRTLSLGNHTGTHVDAPEHFIEGAGTVEGLPVGALVGPCAVVDVTGDPHVSAAALEALFPAGRPVPERMLLRTRNSTGPSPLWTHDEFQPGFAAVAHDAARWLVDRRVRLVGIDYLSVEPYQADQPVTHRTLLGAGVVIVEGLDLRRVTAGAFTLHCLPLLLQGAEGAPARVLLEG